MDLLFLGIEGVGIGINNLGHLRRIGEAYLGREQVPAVGTEGRQNLQGLANVRWYR